MTSSFRFTQWAVVAAVGLAVLAGPGAQGTEATQAGVKVTVEYTGKGTVDASHRIWVWLFDTPEIGPGAMPIGELSIEKNGGTADFTAVAAHQVWVAVAYDEKGGFGGMAPPPSGSPVALYLADGKPGWVTPGTEAAITVTFDDTGRMP
jgi:hypothetical protein